MKWVNSRYTVMSIQICVTIQQQPNSYLWWDSFISSLMRVDSFAVAGGSAMHCWAGQPGFHTCFLQSTHSHLWLSTAHMWDCSMLKTTALLQPIGRPSGYQNWGNVSSHYWEVVLSARDIVEDLIHSLNPEMRKRDVACNWNLFHGSIL